MRLYETLIVGHSPVPGSPGAHSGVAFVDTPSGENLAHYAGLRDSRELVTRCHALNLWASEEEARYLPARTAHGLAEVIARGAVEAGIERIILFGAPVARAFHPILWSEHVLHGTWVTLAEHPGLTLAVCAHPSGLTRAWNVLAYRERLSAFLTAAFAEAKPIRRPGGWA